MTIKLPHWIKPLLLALLLTLQLVGLISAAQSDENEQDSAIQAIPGSLDTTFGNNGIVTTTISSQYAEGEGMVIQSDGKIVVAGHTGNIGGPDFALARYNIDGNLDATFDSDGIVTTPTAWEDAGRDVILQNDGKIVVAGHSTDINGYAFALARYNTDGSLDITFDSDGIVTTTMGLDALGLATALQSDNKIVVVGYSGSGGLIDFALARYNTDGSLDTTFDSDGIVTTTIALDDRAYAVAMQSDNKIVVAGFSDSDLALTRYNTNGSLDTTFDSDGIVTTTIGSLAIGRTVTLQGDNKIVVAGYSGITDIDFTLARYDPNGSLDITFGGDGIVTTDFGTVTDLSLAMALQNDNKIVAAGYSGNGHSADFALARYHSNGSLDATFGNNGTVTTPVGLGDEWIRAVALQNDGKIVVAGYSHAINTLLFTLARYNASFFYNIYMPFVAKPDVPSVIATDP